MNYFSIVSVHWTAQSKWARRKKWKLIQRKTEFHYSWPSFDLNCTGSMGAYCINILTRNPRFKLTTKSPWNSQNITQKKAIFPKNSLFSLFCTPPLWPDLYILIFRRQCCSSLITLWEADFISVIWREVSVLLDLPRTSPHLARLTLPPSLTFCLSCYTCYTPPSLHHQTQGSKGRWHLSYLAPGWHY